MKPITFYLAVSAAPFAICASIPRHLEKGDEISGRKHDDATPPKAWLIDDNQDDNQGNDIAPDRQSSLMLPRPDTPQPSPVYPLSRHRIPNGEKERDPDSDLMRLLYQADVAGHQDQPSHDRNNMLIVYLAAAFMVVVVAMEAWGSAFRRQGAIRLDETTSLLSASVRANADDQDRSLDEKPYV
ncbi:hypothetical protein B0I37DRAFT_350288 [Chaetomium sp. MPI-CAGE-AT-0009]|nr:hypothetical protein B0I37DRAFT_350288 [Chaetomium sp. MPI-CAGE-AT-0009]